MSTSYVELSLTVEADFTQTQCTIIANQFSTATSLKEGDPV